MIGSLNEHHRKLALGCALPLATALAVLLYVYARGGQWPDTVGGGVAYAACVSALVGAAWVANGSGSGTFERFVDSAKTIADEVLMPRLDRLVLGLLGKNADGSPTEIEDRDKVDPPIAVTRERFLKDVGGDAAAADAILKEYAQIAYLMCRMQESFPEDYRAIFRPVV